MSRRRRIAAAFDPGERRQLAGFGAAVAGLHVAGWGLIVLFAARHPVVAGLGVLAYSFGLRHAFDADHIAAIDNSTRKLLAAGGRPLGAGFFFSLGHSTVVLGLSVALAIATGAVHHALPTLALYGGTIGAAVSGGFLWAIGLINTVVLGGIVGTARRARSGNLDQEKLEAQLEQRGLMSRVLRSRFRLLRRSRQMYPLGLLFGLGFDTATEVGLLAITARAASGAIPIPALLALPCLFAAGMSLMDTADGVFMAKAYRWAFSSSARKLYYNLTVTALSVVVALAIGTIELTQVLSARLGWSGGFWAWLRGLDFSALGYGIVALSLLTWLVAALIWRWRRIEQRWQPAAEACVPEP